MSALEDLQNDIYKSITSAKTWPKGISKEDKLQLLEGMIEYWQSKAEYERCQVLQNLKSNLT